MQDASEICKRDAHVRCRRDAHESQAVCKREMQARSMHARRCGRTAQDASELHAKDAYERCEMQVKCMRDVVGDRTCDVGEMRCTWEMRT